jgi:hypothetical protein
MNVPDLAARRPPPEQQIPRHVRNGTRWVALVRDYRVLQGAIRGSLSGAPLEAVGHSVTACFGIAIVDGDAPPCPN